MSGMKFPTHLCGDYFVNQCNDPVFKQPGFNGKYPSFLFFSVAHVTVVLSQAFRSPHRLPTNRADTKKDWGGGELFMARQPTPPLTYPGLMIRAY